MSNFKSVNGDLDNLFLTYDDVEQYFGTYMLSVGQNGYGQLGLNNTTGKSVPTFIITNNNNWASVSCCMRNMAAIKLDGSLWLCGDNYIGQLGTNSLAVTARSSPVQTIATGNNWKQVSCGYYHISAIKTDGTLWIWGGNDSGQLGTNSIANKSSPVQTIATGNNWKQVSCGYNFTAGIKTDGTLWLWGANGSGQLGTNDTTSTAYSSPVQTIATGTDWKQVACGYYHTAAIKTDGTLWLWGINDYGQLGNNNIISNSSPVQTVTTGTNWKQVACGYNFTAGIKTDGTLWLWGGNGSGQLGISSTIRKSSPVQTVATGNDWKYLSCGNLHTAAIKTDGTVWTWGGNGNGQLGTNKTTNTSSPAQIFPPGNVWKTVECHLAQSTYLFLLEE